MVHRLFFGRQGGEGAVALLKGVSLGGEGVSFRPLRVVRRGRRVMGSRCSFVSLLEGESSLQEQLVIWAGAMLQVGKRVCDLDAGSSAVSHCRYESGDCATVGDLGPASSFWVISVFDVIVDANRFAVVTGMVWVDMIRGG